MAPYKTSGSLGLENKVLSLIHLYYSSHLKYTPTSRYSARSYYEVTRSFWSTFFLYGRKIAVA
ncbi:hypothetical protein, partial [Paenibacillus odorifer]|uniref:hypothetical protein n=2 Tax=Paenibacillus TaxID=44249 RepID=UPI001C4B9B66